jgi:aminopeptidase N
MKTLVLAFLLIASASLCAVPALAKDNIEIVGYRARIVPDLAAKTVRGTTTISFKSARIFAGDGVIDVAFPLNALTIDAVRFNGAVVPFRRLPEDSPRELVVSIKPAKAGVHELAVDYHAKPAQGMTFGANYLYTAFSTCHWMLCREESGGKATFRLELTVPSTFKVAASGVALSREAQPGGLTLHTWEQVRPYSPYLFGFAAGEMAEAIEQTPTTALHYLGVGQTPQELKRKFTDTARMLRFFEEKAGSALPHKTYTQILLPGSEAQEASTFSLIGRDQLDPILTDPEEDWVIAHELAHQWWGNLITCKDWSHFWLNEGITVFMVAAYKEQRWGSAAYAREITLAEKRRQNALNANFDVPLAFSGAYPSLAIKRAVTYSKGFLFIDVLRKRLGEEKFWRGIKSYTQAHLGESVVSRDFQRAMEAASGENLEDLFRKWVYPL